MIRFDRTENPCSPKPTRWPTVFSTKDRYFHESLLFNGNLVSKLYTIILFHLKR